MDIMKIATDLLKSKLTGGDTEGSTDNIQSVIGNLFGDSADGGLNPESIVNKLKNSDLGNLAESWLGNGDNEDISKSQLEGLIDSDKLSAAAEQLGTQKDELLSGLQNMLPKIIDMSSKDGNILDSVKGLAGLAGKFLK